MNLRRVVVAALVLSAAVVSLAGCSKSTSVTSPASLSTTPPAAPSNLIGLFDAGQQRDYLIWTASSSANVASYEVWQYSGSPAAGNTGVLVGTAVAGSNYLALPAPQQNGIDYLRIRAKAADGTPSAFSASIQLQRHGAAVLTETDPGESELPIVKIH